MVNDTENMIVIDSWRGEQEYGIPDKRRLTRQRKTYEDAEREDMEWEALQQ